MKLARSLHNLEEQHTIEVNETFCDDVLCMRNKVVKCS